VVRDLTTFGGLLADLRERRGLSQQEFATVFGGPIGCTVDYAQFLESGRAQPSAETVALAASTLSLDADDTGRLYVAAGLLPPGNWCWVDGWVIRPSEEAPMPS
jgi:transcriptional regulator with XRE-family HTH domain